MQCRLRDRADLVALVAHDLTLPPAARRACLTGTVEVMGGFEELSGPDSGWILHCTAKHGTNFIIAVIPDAIRHVYRCILRDRVPWEMWAGRPLAGAGYSIYHGDHPAAYNARRDAERQRRKM
jgi:hypothetical protein